MNPWTNGELLRTSSPLRWPAASHKPFAYHPKPGRYPDLHNHLFGESPMAIWSIGHPEKERVEVELLGAPANDSGYDWISARVKINVGGFTGDVAMMLTLSDIIRFKNALEPVYRDVKGTAEFTTIEGQLQIKVEIDKLGHVKASGFVRDDASFGNRLTFGIEFDQTLLWHTISELDEAILELKK